MTARRNPPQPDETPVMNIRNAMALITPITTRPDLFDWPKDVQQAIEAALARLHRSVDQLEGR